MNEALLLQFLRWCGERPRSYADAMDAWRTSCPRLSIWEDAVDLGLVELGPGGGRAERAVRLTAAGRARLDGEPLPAAAQ
jgi:hypothetical protein